MNELNVVGRLTKDVSITMTEKGVEIGRFTVAVNRPFAKKDDSQQADFLNFTAFGKTALNLDKYCGKGDLISINGRVQSFTYDKKDGSGLGFGLNLIANYVQFLETNKKGNRNLNKEEQYEHNIDEDELPF